MAYVHIDDKYEPYLDLMMDCIKINGDDIKEVVDRINKDVDTMGECLEDNFLNFKYHSKKVRDEYENAVNKEIEKNTKVWEKCEELLHKSRPTIENIKNDVESIGYLIDGLNEKLNSDLDMNLYKVERLLRIIEEINNMSPTDKEMLKKVLEIKDK